MKISTTLPLYCLVLSAATAPAWAQTVQANANPVHTLTFDTAERGEKKAIARWGLDTTWPEPNNVRRGLLYIGRESVSLVRVSFPVRFALENGQLPAAADQHFASRLQLARTVGDVPLTMMPDTEAIVGPWYKDGKDVNPQRWAQLIAASQRKYGVKMESVETFNEPDYGWGQGDVRNLADILRALRQNPEFAGVQLSGPSTLNADAAMPWYNEIKTQLDRGTTHALGGTMDSFIGFYRRALADGKIADQPELHNLAEAIAGAEYGIASAIWWGAPELARGEFVKAGKGGRLAYAEDRANWSAAAVYRAPNGQLQAFLGASERQGKATTYRFVSRDRPVFFDGDGPRHEYTATIRKDNERVVNISWGADVPPKIDGRFYVVNRFSGKVLGVAASSAANGAVITQMNWNGAANQQWEIAPLAKLYGDQSYYAIRAVHSGKTLDLADYSHEEGARAQQWGEGEGVAQNWFFEYAGDNDFRIRSRWSTQYLQLDGASKAAGAAIVQTARNGDAWQKWRLVPISAGKIEFDAPRAPTVLSATAKAATVELKWTPSAESDVSGYTILRATSDTGAYDTIARDVKNSGFVDSEIGAGQNYFYKIKAIDRCLNSSDFSAPANVKAGAGLIASYNFENNTRDESGNALAAYGAPDYALGRNGSQAIVLDGANDYLELPRAIGHARDLTFSAWVYPQASESWQRIFDIGSDEEHYLFLTGADNDGTIRVEAKNGAESVRLEAPGLPGNQWSHVAFTLGGDAARLYVNGKEVARSDAWTIRPADFGPIFNFVGKSQFAADPLFKGRLDNVQIYNSALSPAQIARLSAPKTQSEQRNL